MPPVWPIDEVIKALLADTNFKYQLSRLILKDLDRADFVTGTDLEAKIREAMATTSDLPAEVSGLCERVAKIKHKLFKPEGVIAMFRKKSTSWKIGRPSGPLYVGVAHLKTSILWKRCCWLLGINLSLGTVSMLF